MFERQANSVLDGRFHLMMQARFERTGSMCFQSPCLFITWDSSLDCGGAHLSIAKRCVNYSQESLVPYCTVSNGQRIQRRPLGLWRCPMPMSFKKESRCTSVDGGEEKEEEEVSLTLHFGTPFWLKLFCFKVIDLRSASQSINSR